MSGCLLYIYQANTSTPAVAYQSPGLTVGQELPWPIVADSSGRIPAFWLADGAYRARLTDENGVVQFDEQNILSVGSGTGPITVPSTPDEAILTTGDVLWRPAAATKNGWVRLNGRTIGSGASGASERANADCLALFTYLWQTFSDAICPVISGRGANAANDWAANKQITLIDMRGKGPIGLDDMGNSAAGILTGVSFDAGNATTGGSKGGDATVVLGTANLPPYTPSGGVSVVLNSRVRNNLNAASIAAGSDNIGVDGPDTTISNNNTMVTQNAATFSGAAQGGTSTPVQNISPFVLGTWYMRL